MIELLRMMAGAAGLNARVAERENLVAYGWRQVFKVMGFLFREMEAGTHFLPVIDDDGAIDEFIQREQKAIIPKGAVDVFPYGFLVGGVLPNFDDSVSRTTT